MQKKQVKPYQQLLTVVAFQITFAALYRNNYQLGKVFYLIAAIKVTHMITYTIFQTRFSKKFLPNSHVIAENKPKLTRSIT